MPAFTIRIPADAAGALRDLAAVECRTPRDQAAFLVLQGLRTAALTGRRRQDQSVPSRPTNAPERQP